jgi:hypothetical protein
MPGQTTPIITPTALPAVARRDIPAAIAGAVGAAMAVGYMTSYIIWHYTPDSATIGFHFASLLKSGADLMNFGWEGYAHEYTQALRSVGFSIVWKLTATYTTAVAAGVFTYTALAKETDPIRHYRGRKLVDWTVLDSESKKEASKTDYEVCKIGDISVNRERIARSGALIGSTGGGKTVGLLSILYDLDKNGYSMLIVDGPKGDFGSMDGFFLDALRIAPWNKGAIWDIAADCPTRAAAVELAKRLIPEGSDPFWSNCARFAFVVAAVYLIETQGKKWGWGELYEACSASIETMKERADLYYPPAAAVFVDAESKTTQSVMINFTAFMSDVFEMSLAWGNAPSDWIRFSFIDWIMERGESGKQRHVIIQTSGEWESTGRAFCASVIGLLSKIVVSPSLRESKTRKKVTVIDELGVMGKLEIDKTVEAGRSKGCSLILATQSPHQLKEIYGENQLNSLFAMLGFRVFARIMGDDDQNWVAKQIGRREIDTPTNSVSTSGGGYTVTNSYQRGEEWVIHPSSLQKLGPKKELGGVNVVVDGWDDVAITLIKFPKFKAVREPFILNPFWNVSINTKPAEIEVNNIHKPEFEVNNIQKPAEIVEITQEITQNYIINEVETKQKTAEIEENDALDAATDGMREHTIDSAASELIGGDVHGVGALLNALEEIESSQNNGETAEITPTDTTITVKKTRFVSRKKMKQQQKDEEKA